MKKVTIKVVGSDPPCPKCLNFLEIAARVAKKHDVVVEHVNVLSPEAKKLKVLVVPSIFVDDKLVAAGDVVDEAELESFVEKALSLGREK
ncbi:MAG: thioredoxin family protein [Candidatus Brockarchaeota archaeon]|nr:thioredoxin family protein [Candidatus Brockarchaeota archaeon]